MEGVDYSTGRPNLTQLWNANKRFVCRYLAYPYSTGPNPKVLTATEREQLHNAGFAILLNWEQDTGDMLKGYATGVAHASKALALANDLGAPSDTPIYFSCDTDARESQFAKVGQYLDGCATVLGYRRVGVYGSYRIIEAMVPTHAAWGWQTYAWSNGLVSPKAHVRQYRNGVTLAGASVDLDLTLKTVAGLWYPGGVMVTEDEMNRIADRVWTRHLQYGEDGYVDKEAQIALAYAWQRAQNAEDKAEAALSAVTDLATRVQNLIDNLPTGGIDLAPLIAALNNTNDSVTALNNRLSTP